MLSIILAATVLLFLNMMRHTILAILAAGCCSP